MRRLSLTLVPRRSCISLSTSPFVVVGVAHALANWLHSPWLWIHRSLLVKIKWNSMAEYVYYIYYQRIIGYVWWLGTYPASWVYGMSTINNQQYHTAPPPILRSQNSRRCVRRYIISYNCLHCCVVVIPSCTITT